MKYESETKMASFKIKGKDEDTKETEIEFPVTMLYCKTPTMWQSKSPILLKAIFKTELLRFLAREQNRPSNINPNKNPPVGPKRI